MTTARDIADAIRRTITGPVWHGSPLDELLAGITPAEAAARPAANAHSIWELVLHIAVWANVPRRRLAGERVEVTPAEDFPAVRATDDGAWRAALDGMRRAYEDLARDVERLDESALASTATGQPYNVEFMLRGVVEHGAYHGGQIGILRKMVRR